MISTIRLAANTAPAIKTALQLHNNISEKEIFYREIVMPIVRDAVAAVAPAILFCPNNKEGRIYNLFLAGGAGSAIEWGLIIAIIDIIVLVFLGLALFTLNNPKRISH
jgi:uncharacterized membrane protein